jgi:1,4-dihydroxy-2-naphthoyl-CoA hydrolase
VDEVTERFRNQVPFAGELGIEVREFASERVVLAGSWSPDRCTTGSILHGGYVMGIADCAGGACAFLNLPSGAAGTATIESKTNFIAAVRGGTVTATATPVHVGRTTILVQTDVCDATGRLVARTLQTQAVLRDRTA